MDVINQPSTDNSYKKKTEDITSFNFGQKKSRESQKKARLSNTIERIKEEDADIRVKSSGGSDSDKRAETSSSISGGDPNAKDQYGATKALRHQILKKYQFIEILGKGSYGCVSKAKCLQTGKVVALKIMEN